MSADPILSLSECLASTAKVFFRKGLSVDFDLCLITLPNSFVPFRVPRLDGEGVGPVRQEAADHAGLDTVGIARISYALLTRVYIYIYI